MKKTDEFSEGQRAAEDAGGAGQAPGEADGAGLAERLRELEARLAAAKAERAAFGQRVDETLRGLAAKVETLEAHRQSSLWTRLTGSALRRPWQGFRLRPHHDVRRSPDAAWQWESTGDDAQFILGRNIRRGWYRLTWRGRAELPLPLRLYVDYGQGFSEEFALNFGALDVHDERESQFIPIDRLAASVRLDVGNQPARFDLAIEEWTRQSSLSVQLVALEKQLGSRGGWRPLFSALTSDLQKGPMAAWRGLRKEALFGRYQLPAAPPAPSGPLTQGGPPAPRAVSRAEAEAAILALPSRPTVSLLVPCYDTRPEWLTDLVASVEAQYYPHWELLLVDDASPSAATRAALKALEGRDPRIRVLWQERNGGISAATNAALEAATGALVAMLDHDDTLTPDALYEVVGAFAASPSLDAVYSDQDKIDEAGARYEPFYKPDWSPELLRGVMYVGHLLVVRRELAREVGGFDTQFDKVQDFEFMLRVSERTSRIGHVAKVLYHWRSVPGSVARGAGEKSGIAGLQARAVSAHLARLGVAAEAAPHPTLPHRVVLKPGKLASTPQVSIIIPTKDAPQHISRCLDSIFAKTTYPAFEVVVVDNGTTDAQALAAIARHPVKVVPFGEKFNYSKANNLGVAASTGEVLVLLNNDTEVIDADWLETLVFHLQQPGVGMVGPLLLYPNGTVQHAGVVLGFRGTADHVMRGAQGDSDGYAGSLCCTRETSAVTAACVALRRADYLAGGGLVEYYGNHYQDVDLCLRLRAAGQRILFVPRARLYHHESATRGTSYDLLDRALLLDTWGQVIERGDPYYNPNLSLHRFDYSVRDDAAPSPQDAAP